MAVASVLEQRIIAKMAEENLWTPGLQAEIPTKWEKHGNLILFPITAFCSENWSRASYQFWEMVCKVLRAKRAAKKVGPIERNSIREPKVQLLHGDCAWVSKKENHIRYDFDITTCMFSSGNISEKLRISSWDCRGQTVVDMYAGIGYFTLSYLVHAKAALVYAIEINPNAVFALRENVSHNLKTKSDKCVILVGNNLEICPRNVAHHVNLGLLPSSEAAWETACGALKRGCGGVLHIHEVVNIRENHLPKQVVIDGHFMKVNFAAREISFPNAVLNRAHAIAVKINVIFRQEYKDEGWFAYVNDISMVKSYAPYLYHVVIDVKCCYKAQTTEEMDTSELDYTTASESDSSNMYESTSTSIFESSSSNSSESGS